MCLIEAAAPSDFLLLTAVYKLTLLLLLLLLLGRLAEVASRGSLMFTADVFFSFFLWTMIVHDNMDISWEA